MTGTLINIAAVLVGGALGLTVGARLPQRIRQTVLHACGLFTVAMGVRLFLETANPLIALGSLILGGILGEWWRIEDRLRGLGAALEARFPGSKAGTDPNRFVQGFLTASLVFCVGPMTILGSIEDGLTGNYDLLAVKSALDGFAAMVFASTLGPGVLCSVLVIAVYQGGLTLAAAQAQAVLNEAMAGELSAAGGVILIGIAISSLLELKPIRTGNLLPALLVAPLLFALFLRLGLL